jgi:hypothetical protein
LPQVGQIIGSIVCPFALALTLITAPANAHCYRIWHYLKPQRCYTALAPEQIRNRGRHVSALASLPPERIDITLPPLDWVECPPAEERLVGIAKLRALSEVSAQR